MEDGGHESAHDDAAAEADVPSRRASARAAAAEREYRPAVPLAMLRCLNKTHPANCTRCTAPPTEEQEQDYELVGEPGAKNGEKKLRSGLSHSEEWACTITRNRTADALEAAARAPGAPADAPADAATLAAALRSRDSAKLRKRHMLALVRIWHYKSDVWRRKHARGEYRRAAQEEEAAAVALALHSSMAGAQGRHGGAGAATRASGASTFSAIAALGAAAVPAAITAFAAAELQPLAAAAAAWMRGAELRAAMTLPSSSGAAVVARQADAAHHQGCADVCAGLRAEMTHAASTLRAWKVELMRLAPLEAAQPAWSGLAALHEGCPVEAALLRLRRVLSVAAGVAQTLHVPPPHAATDGAAGAAVGLLAASGARPMEAAAAARGLAAAYSSAQEWLARAMAALISARLASVNVYLDIAATVGDEASLFLTSWEAAARDRAAWINAAISAATTHHHSTMRGAGAMMPPQAAASMPQMTAAQLAAALELAPGLPGMAAAVAALCAAHLPRLQQAQGTMLPPAPPEADEE